MPDPETLHALLEHAGALKESGASKPVILDSIAEICARAGLHLGYDEYSTKKPERKGHIRINCICVRGRLTIPTDLSLHPLVHAPTTVENFFQGRTDLDTRRVIIFPQKRDGKVLNTLSCECNGVVIDPETWKVLALPPQTFNKMPKYAQVNDFLSQGLYRVCPISDGTLVTIYHWNHPTKGGIWCIASSQGHDVSPVFWMGPECYAEILYRMLDKEKLGMKLIRDHLEEGDCRLTFDKLDKSYSYTIGFRNHNFHPLLTDPEKIWDAHQCELYTCAVVHDKGITGQDETCIDTPARIQDLSTQGFLDKAPGEVTYGYALRSLDPKTTGVYSNVLVDTDLLRFIRRAMYGQPTLKKKLDHTNRLLHQVIRASLDRTTADTFHRLYPQFKETRRVLDQVIQETQDLIIHIHRTDTLHPHTDKVKQDDTPINVLARGILGHILRTHPHFQSHNSEAKVIVKSYLLLPDHAILYMPVVQSRMEG